MNGTDRKILGLAAPAFGALIAEPVYVLTDTAIVGHIGTDELAGLAVAAAILATGFAAMIFLAYGTTGMVARARGAGDTLATTRLGIQGIWLAAISGTLIAVLAFVFSNALIGLFEITPSVTQFALTYLRISLLGFPALLIGLAAMGFLRGVQDTKTPLVVAALGAIANAAIELVFVFVFDWGVAGSAWSTVLVQWAVAIYLVRLIVRTARHDSVSLAPQRELLLRYAHIGGLLFVRTAAMRAAFLTSTLLAAKLSTVDLAAHQIGLEVYSAAAYALDAIGIAGQALIGEALGARDAGLARRLAKRMTIWGFWAGALAMLVLAITHNLIPLVFSADPDVRSVVAQLLLIFAVSQPIAGVVFVLDGILIGAGDLRYLAIAAVLTASGFILVALLLPSTLLWLWVALGAYMAFRAISLLIRIKQQAWVTLGH